MRSAYYLLALACLAATATAKKPNILYLLVDDLGWADVGYNNPNVNTPNIDKLARKGLTLTQTYFAPVCTPSRGALMTGKYPFAIGLQHNVLLATTPECTPLDRKMLPQALKEQGYDTHMAGKWHLGFCNWTCTPTYRGFDTFYGFYQGYISHFTHMVDGGYDWRDDKRAAVETNGTYSTFLIRDRVKKHIRDHRRKRSKPFFIYSAFAAVHSPLEYPPEYANLYLDEPDHARADYLRMLSALDDAIGDIVKELKRTKQLDNTIIVFSSDNGGEGPGGSNAPLRGQKASSFEGGVRVPAFISGPGVRHKQTSDGLVHVTDWFPTLLAQAGGDPESMDLDGVDQSEMMFHGGESARDEIPLHIDSYSPPMFGRAAIRVGDYKLIQGYSGLWDGYHGSIHLTYQGMRRRTVTPHYSFDMAAITRYAELVQDQVQLFNIKDDPEERHEISASEPDVVEHLMQRLDYYRSMEKQPDAAHNNPAGDATHYGGIWTPGWCNMGAAHTKRDHTRRDLYRALLHF